MSRYSKPRWRPSQRVLGNNYSDSLQRVITRHSYLRQFAPALIQHITFQADPRIRHRTISWRPSLSWIMNDAGKYALPEDAPTGFIPKKLRPFVFQDGKPYKPAWECALLTALRDQVKSGNLAVPHSKRFANLDTFFIPETEGHLSGRRSLPAPVCRCVPVMCPPT